MKFALAALTMASIAATAAPACAQASLEANVARSEGQWGGELGAGYSVIAIEGFRVTPGVGVFLFDGGRDGYVDAGAQCVDEATAAPAPEEFCDGSSARLFARAEATYTIPLAGITAGLGGRFMSGDLRPYATISVPLLPLLSLKANAGHKYYAAGLNARF